MPSILIIDDDVVLLAHLAAQLEDAGFEVARSSDLRHAEILYVDHRPDLVLLEVRSESDRGWDLLGRVAAETPVIVLSAAAREEDVVRAFEEGACDHIAKPYRSAELLARVRARLPATIAAPVTTPLSPPAPELAPTVTSSAAAPEAVVADVLAAHRATQRRNPRGAPSDESVFMSEAEEMALLRAPLPPPADQPAPAPLPDGGEGALGLRMRVERLRRHLTLVQVENELKIRMSYLQAMEDEKLTLLPRGPAAPQMLKDYADFLGLDASAALEELRAQHHAEAVPLPALGGSRMNAGLPRWAIVVAAVLLALVVGAGAISVLDPGFFARLLELLPR